MLKHPYRDYYIYRGLTRNDNYYSNHISSSLGNSHSTLWIILFIFLMYLGKGDSSFQIAIIILFGIPCVIVMSWRYKWSKLAQKDNMIQQRKVTKRANQIRHQQTLQQKTDREQNKRIKRLHQHMRHNMPDGLYKQTVFKDEDFHN